MFARNASRLRLQFIEPGPTKRAWVETGAQLVQELGADVPACLCPIDYLVDSGLSATISQPDPPKIVRQTLLALLEGSYLPCIESMGCALPPTREGFGEVQFGEVWGRFAFEAQHGPRGAFLGLSQGCV